MAYIETVPEDQATGQLAAFYEADCERVGYVANCTRVFSHCPEVYAARQSPGAAVKANVDLRRYEPATLATAKALRSSYCCLAHGKVLLGFMDEAELVGLMEDRALMAFAGKVTLHAYAVTQADIDALKGHGLTDSDILDIVRTDTARNFFSHVLDALGTLPDAAYRDMDPDLLGVLSVGRRVEAESA